MFRATLLLPLAILTSATIIQSAPPFDPWPVRVDMQFNWNVRLVTPQQMNGAFAAPWYAYFPYDSEARVTTKDSYPHWPQPFPPKSDEQKEGASSVSRYQPAAPGVSRGPSYWYQK